MRDTGKHAERERKGVFEHKEFDLSKRALTHSVKALDVSLELEPLK
jgi:hypothetical protein